MRTKIAVFLSLIILFSRVLTGQTIMETTEHQVALAGVIELVHGFGPPGYGEDKRTDRKITYWVLRTPSTINIPCTPEKPEWASTDCAATDRLRLFLPINTEGEKLEAKMKALRGHKAIVTGLLRRRDTMGEITPIYMNVIELAPSNL